MIRENKKVAIIYILTGIIILLIIYLCMFAYKTLNPPKKTVHTVIKEPTVSESCTFNMEIGDFNKISSNENLCAGLNKIVLANVVLNSKPQNVSIYYSKNIIDGMGVYINGKLAISDKVLKTHLIGIFDNKLFITDYSDSVSDFNAYDETGSNVYNLRNALSSFQIEDPAFKAMNLKNQILSVNNIDASSFKYENGKITFNSKAQCVNGISGSSYSILYSGNAFSSPAYVANVNC